MLCESLGRRTGWNLYWDSKEKVSKNAGVPTKKIAAGTGKNKTPTVGKEFVSLLIHQNKAKGLANYAVKVCLQSLIKILNVKKVKVWEKVEYFQGQAVVSIQL